MSMEQDPNSIADSNSNSNRSIVKCQMIKIQMDGIEHA
jgi:hypothetical protein